MEFNMIADTMPQEICNLRTQGAGSLAILEADCNNDSPVNCNVPVTPPVNPTRNAESFESCCTACF